MKKKTVIILSILTVLIGGAIVFYYLKAEKKEKTEWLTEHPARRDLQLLVTATGTVNAVQSVEVGTQVSGVISKIWVDYNDLVRKDQPIAQLDVSNLQSTLDEANANFLKAQSLFIQTKEEYDRNQFLLEKKVIPKADYDLALSNYQSAKNSVTAAYAQVRRAKTNLQYATIKAPINGVIVSREVDVGQTVAASFATPKLFVIANDLKKMQLQANVDEADIGQVNTGQKVFFKVDAYPADTFYGSVQQIRLQPNTIQNVVNYTVVINAPNPDLKLLPGMNADISIVVLEKKNVLTVPLAATKYIPKGQDSTKRAGSRVYVLEKDGVKPVEITAGISDGIFVEVTKSNITPNSQLITGIVTKEMASQSKGLFQGPRTGTHSTMRNMQR
jgi:HlyD family secretion protein